MGKRAKDTAGVTSAKKGKVASLSKYDAEKFQEIMDIARQHNPIAGSILDAISKGGEDHGSLPAWVRRFTTPADATQLAAVFPRISSMTYMSHPWKEGLSCASLWVLSDAKKAVTISSG